MTSDVEQKHLGAMSLVGLVAGSLFGAGLVVGGMTDPARVQGFLDFTGRWDPTLAFVMGGAVVVHSLAYFAVKRRKAPVFTTSFQIPTRKDIDARLLLGAGLFGLGWGLGGFCPGPAITSLPFGGVSVLAFVVALLTSSWTVGWLETRLGRAAELTPAERDRSVPSS